MRAEMRILGWKTDGLRCPDHEIQICSADNQEQLFQASLIQMPNGTGKTTTLKLIRASLSGAAKNWDAKKILEFRKRCNNKPEGSFEIKLLLNNKITTIRMEFDFENERVVYKTTYGSGQNSGFHPPHNFLRFMNDKFVNFYVFDGELAQNLLNQQHTDAQTVVEHLFQTNLFVAMKKEVDEYWVEMTKEESTTKKGLTRHRNSLKRLKEQLDTCKDQKREHQNNLSRLETKYKRMEGVYDQELKKNKDVASALTSADLELTRLISMVSKEASEVLERARNPHALSTFFARNMVNLKKGLDKVKLPESAAKEFFDDLANEDECVCGRPIDSEIAVTIRSRSKKYLGSDDVAFLNSLKSAIKDATGDSIEKSENDLNLRLEKLKKAVCEEQEARNNRDSQRLMAEQADPKVEDARKEMEELRSQINRVEYNLEKFESRDDSQSPANTFGIEILEKQIKNTEKKLAKTEKTLTEKAKRDILIDIIKNAHDKSHSGITRELRKEANSRISKLMPYNRVSIDSIDRALILEGQEGGSVGETLSIAYAFLATLFDRSDHQLPFIVDSPAGPIDLAVRPEIGMLIPKLTNQFIAFTISSERDKFTEPLKQSSNSKIQFITIFRKGQKKLEQLAYRMGSGSVIETSDGVNVTGEEFFNEFQLEQEDMN